MAGAGHAMLTLPFSGIFPTFVVGGSCAGFAKGRINHLSTVGYWDRTLCKLNLYWKFH